MKKKNPKETSSFRLAGQRSITSSLTAFRSSDPSLITQTGRPGNGGRISLSDFLTNKLHKSSVLPVTSKVSLPQDTATPVLASRENFSGPLQIDFKKVNDGVDKECLLDISVFDKFKPVVNDADEENASSCIAESVDSSNKARADVQEPKKRQATFDYGSEYEPVKRRVVVLGDDPRPSSITSHKKSGQSVTHYNHYADGKGWWDSNMEGVDNEAVGSSEVWEGVGSTTLGGLDWH